MMEQKRTRPTGTTAGRAKTTNERSANASDYTPSPDHLQAILGKLEGVRQAGPRQWTARCPAHDDRHASLSVGQGDDGRVLLHCHAGCAVNDILAALGLGTSQLFSNGRSPQRPFRGQNCRNPADFYDYRDRHGRLLFQVVRYRPKGSRQRRPEGSGRWAWNLNGVPRVLYRLPELSAGDDTAWVFVVEGEKDADALAGLGLLATTNPGGAGKWAKLADDSALHGRRVAIIPDKDEAGEKHAQDVAARLHGKAAVVKIVELACGEVDGRPINDASDWLDSLDGKEPEDLAAALLEIAEAAPAWTPNARTGDGPVLVRLADVEPEEVRWLWPGRIALGKLMLLAGDPGLGKSFVTLDMAARVSSGAAWPDCPETYNPAGGVVLLSAEDDLADTVRPRLDAAGADVNRVVALQAVRSVEPDTGAERRDPFNLATDLPELERQLRLRPIAAWS